MFWIKEYLLSVVAISAICGCLRFVFSGKLAAWPWIRFLCGILLACTVIKPILSLDAGTISFNYQTYKDEGSQIVQTAQEAAFREITSGIKQKTQSYILDKANAWEVVLDVDVTVSDMVPSAVTIRGAVSPYVKTVLSKWITEQLGIPREAQEWIVFQL